MIEPSFSLRIPDGDERARRACDHCGFVAYENPKIVVGSVVRHEGRILLCRRAIEPRSGFWTIPAGYMELGETPEEGAMREAREEAGASLAIQRLLAVYSVPRISQVQLIFRATLAEPTIAAGPESLEVKLVPPDEIPVGRPRLSLGALGAQSRCRGASRRSGGALRQSKGFDGRPNARRAAAIDRGVLIRFPIDQIGSRIISPRGD